MNHENAPDIAAPVIAIDTGSASDVGCVRKVNEDSVLFSQDKGIWLLADGMGGHQGGDVASQVAVTHSLYGLTNKLSPKDAINDSHQQIRRMAETEEGFTGMGSTIVVALLQGRMLNIAWVGDSRAYRVRGHDSQATLEQLTKDHSYVQMLFDQGKITRHEMQKHPQKHVITQCLGSTEMESIQVSEKQFSFDENDRILLCSDGLYDSVDEAFIEKTVASSKGSQEIADTLLSKALENGASDNVSVLILIHKGPADDPATVVRSVKKAKLSTARSGPSNEDRNAVDVTDKSKKLFSRLFGKAKP